MSMRLPDDALVILAGPPGAGKSTWARTALDGRGVVSSDALRALVGEAGHDQRAGGDALALLDDVVSRRLRRGLLTVVDTLGFDRGRRAAWIAAARRHGRPVHAVLFDVEDAVARRRNRERDRPVPAAVVRGHLARWPQVRAEVRAEVDVAHAPGPAVVVPPDLVTADVAATRQQESPMALRFGLHVSTFGAPRAQMGDWLGRIAATAEQVGFESVWVMDHLVQIPQVGREWDDLLDGPTASTWIAAHTQHVRVGVLVHSLALRHPLLVARSTAALDVLSAGRAVCGLGMGWFEREHDLLGVDFPSLDERHDRLADAVEALPLLWGPGSPSFSGRRWSIRAATCYPRPLSDPLPLLVGGQGPRRTLPLVARSAQACNLRGDPATVRGALRELGAACDEADRDVGEIEVTHLSSALVGVDHDDAQARLAARHPDPVGRSARGRAVGVGSVVDQVGRYRALAEAGVQTAVVALDDLDVDALERFAPVIAAFA